MVRGGARGTSLTAIVPFRSIKSCLKEYYCNKSGRVGSWLRKHQENVDETIFIT